jgi:ribosomal protein S4E
LDDLIEKDIETVIPKENGSHVIVLKGDFKGESGTIISRDRKKD